MAALFYGKDIKSMFNSWLENRILNKIADRLLPNVTTEDVGKMLFVGTHEQPGKIAVPFGTYTEKVGNLFIVDGYNLNDLRLGDKLLLKITINGSTSSASVIIVRQNDFLGFTFENYTFNIDGDVNVVTVDANGADSVTFGLNRIETVACWVVDEA